MANKWRYQHGVTLNGITVNAEDDDVVGNVLYVDPNNPNASDTADNRGCANVPYATLDQVYTDGKSRNSRIILATGTHSAKHPFKYLYSDDIFGAVLSIDATWSIYGLTHYDIIYVGDYPFAYTGTSQIYRATVSNSSGTFTAMYYSLLLDFNTIASASYSVIVSVTLSTATLSRNLIHGCVYNAPSLGGIQNNVFWNGTINYTHDDVDYTSDLDARCALITAGTNTEAEVIALVESDLGLTAGDLADNGFRLLNPHFINPDKGNYNIDYLNYDCSEILALRDSAEWIINRGIKCEFPDNFIGDSADGFTNTPDSDDGFSGALKCYNIDSSGNITNTAYDTVLVTQKFSLTTPITLDKINWFGKLLATVFDDLNATDESGTNSPDKYDFYMIGYAASGLEVIYNSDDNTFSYTDGVFSTDFPRFIFNQDLQVNTESDEKFGKWENGSADIDEERNIYVAAVKEFRIIAVKKGE